RRDDDAGGNGLPGGGGGAAIFPAPAGGGQFQAYQNYDEDGCLALRDGRGSAQGAGDVRAGGQPGAVGDDRVGAGAGGGPGADQRDRHDPLVDRGRRGRRSHGVGGQPGPSRPGRAAGGEAPAEAVLPHDRTPSRPPQEIANEGFMTIFVAFGPLSSRFLHNEALARAGRDTGRGLSMSVGAGFA